MEVAKLVPNASDAERAAIYRDDLMPLLNQIAEVMTKAKRDGLTVNFQISPPDAFGRVSIAMLEISKKLI